MPNKQQRASLLHRLRQACRLGKPTADPEASRLVSRMPVSKARRVQRQSTLSVPTELLLQALALKLGASDEVEAAIEELSLLLRWQVRHTLQESSLWLVDAFDRLSSSDPQVAVGGGASGVDWEAKREELSDRFIDHLCALMQRANYKLLSQREWQFAKSENFMFVMPVDVAWESLDASLISRLFVRHPHLGLQAAQLSRRVLVFHRGSGIEQRTAWFLEEKLDMAIDKLFTHPFRRLCRSLYRRLCSNGDDFLEQSSATRRASPSDYELANGLRHTQRVNLDRLLPSLSKLVRRFFFRLTVQEPTFQEVAVFYSEIGSASIEPLPTSGPSAAAAAVCPTETSVPQMRLKSFRDIPIADVEVVFPGLRVERMKSADFVKILLFLLAGVATALYGYFFAQGGGWFVRESLIGLLAGRAFQTWRYVMIAKATMDDFIRSTLYHRSQDSQKGVLLYALNSIEQHEHREALLLYLLLLAQVWQRTVALATLASRAARTIFLPIGRVVRFVTQRCTCALLKCAPVYPPRRLGRGPMIPTFAPPQQPSPMPRCYARLSLRCAHAAAMTCAAPCNFSGNCPEHAAIIRELLPPSLVPIVAHL